MSDENADDLDDDDLDDDDFEDDDDLEDDDDDVAPEGNRVAGARARYRSEIWGRTIERSFVISERGRAGGAMDRACN